MFFEDDIFTFLAKNDMDLKMKGSGALYKEYTYRLFKEAIEDSGKSPMGIMNNLDSEFMFYQDKLPFRATLENYEMLLHTKGMARRFEKDGFGLGKAVKTNVSKANLLNNKLEGDIAFLSRKFMEAEQNNEPADYQNYIMRLFDDALNFYPSTPEEIKQSLLKEFDSLDANSQDENLETKCRTYVTMISMIERSKDYEPKVDKVDESKQDFEVEEIVDDCQDFDSM